jgi:hypothetical protein
MSFFVMMTVCSLRDGVVLSLRVGVICTSFWSAKIQCSMFGTCKHLSDSQVMKHIQDRSQAKEQKSFKHNILLTHNPY